MDISWEIWTGVYLQELRCEFWSSQSHNLQMHEESYMPIYQSGRKYIGIYGYVWLNRKQTPKVLSSL